MKCEFCGKHTNEIELYFCNEEHQNQFIINEVMENLSKFVKIYQLSYNLKIYEKDTQNIILDKDYVEYFTSVLERENYRQAREFNNDLFYFNTRKFSNFHEEEFELKIIKKSSWKLRFQRLFKSLQIFFGKGK